MANQSMTPPPPVGGFAPPGGMPIRSTPPPASDSSTVAYAYGTPVVGQASVEASSAQASISSSMPTPPQGPSTAVNRAPFIRPQVQPIPAVPGGPAFHQTNASQPATLYGSQARTVPVNTPGAATPAGSEIHTMPEKFLPTIHLKKKTGPFKRILIVGGAILFVMAAITTVVVFLFTRQQQTNNNIAPVNTNAVLNVNLTNQANANSNTNAIATNGNVNTVVNSNGNSNANAPINTNANTNSSLIIPVSIVSTKDTDKDALTDNEEIIWGSASAKPDTDGDGFLDGEEITSGYSPTSNTPLAQDPNAVMFLNETYGYTIIYPARWVAGKFSGSDVDVLFTAETGEFVEVTVASNDKQLTARQWYIEQFPDIDQRDIETFTASGLVGVKSTNGLTGYVASGNIMYVITYNIGTREAANFLSTFAMMLSTFVASSNDTIDTSNSDNNNSAN